MIILLYENEDKEMETEIWDCVAVGRADGWKTRGEC